MGNRRLAVEVAGVLHRHGALAGIVLPPAGSQIAVRPMAQLGVPIWEWPTCYEQVRGCAPEVLLSVHFEYKLPPDWLRLACAYPLNLHLGLLPYNRGRAPHIWPLMDGSPSGVSLHVMDDGIDAGPILAQTAIPAYPDDTGASLLARLEAASLALVDGVWPTLSALNPVTQPDGGSVHSRADIEELRLTAAELRVIDKLRALTEPRGGAEFTRDGRRYRARISIAPLD